MDDIIITEIEVAEPSRLKRAVTRGKTFVVDHKSEFIVGAIGLAVGALVGYKISKKTGSAVDALPIGSDVSFLTAVASSYKPTINNVDLSSTTIINEEPVTRLSYIVKDGDKYYKTQSEYAEAIGVTPLHVSNYLNGKRDTLNGHTPERFGVRSES